MAEAQTSTKLRENEAVSSERPQYEDLARCVHCGLCLNHCPTYRLWGMEADSPRGRIRQMVLVEEGKLEVNESYVTHIDRCLDCRACETACPSGVEYGKLVELARAQIAREYRRPFFSRVVSDFVYRKLLPWPRRIAAVARILRFYQRSGLQQIARTTNFLGWSSLKQKDLLLPPVDSDFFFAKLGQTYPAIGERRARVAFFAGCVAQVTFTALNEATIRVLQANGCEVVVPGGQLCCGALAAHAGVRDAARELACANMNAFSEDGIDAIITNAAGCGSTLKEYAHLFPEGTAEQDGAREFSRKMRDVTEFLAELGLVAPLNHVPLRVTYQDSCHLLHGQKVRAAPRKLIQSIPGIEFVEMPYSDLCCGSAGVYNVTQPKASMELLRDKMRNARSTSAPLVVTANPGCILQLRAGAQIHETGQEVIHVVELLDRAIARK
ncbi:MAG: (Fe-S)-binding protein [Candidatus Acidiferrales bacterium]